MNDRFKFRCFDKENKCMHYPSRYSNFNIVNGVIVKIDSYLTGNGVYRGKRVAYEFDDAVLMQCTGLKDKNGKLVYEGDILKQPDGIIDYVYWSDGCYIHNGTAITNYDICYQGDTWAKEVNTHEVIGNIYENEELLED